jgi:16S rRNA (cytosine967-C5)-methyltransferase
VSARRAAAELLVAVLERGRALDLALAETESFAQLQGRDRAFARAIATAALRRLGRIDAVLAHFLDRPLPETAGLARALLRTGAAQVLVLQTPAHAAVSETVDVANAARAARPFAKLLNAVLRKVAREGLALFAQMPAQADLPAWLTARWRAAYGEQIAMQIAGALGEEPPLDLTVKESPEAWAEKLGAIMLPTGSLRTPSPRGERVGGRGEPPRQAPESADLSPPLTPFPLPSRGVESLPGYAEGAWWVQDAAAALPARLLGDVRGKAVLDLCAAPGGKTLQLAAAGARVTALDSAPERLDLVRQNLARTGLAADIVCTDALAYRAPAPFDAVLLDAPCTATGTLRRHPDIAWLRRPDDVRKLAALQTKLLASAASLLKPGGVLVYAVCSLEPEEGPAIVESALRAGAWNRAPLQAEELPGAADFITPEGDLRTLPAHWPELGGLDGFYVARLIRR